MAVRHIFENAVQDERIGHLLDDLDLPQPRLRELLRQVSGDLLTGLDHHLARAGRLRRVDQVIGGVLARDPLEEFRLRQLDELGRKERADHGGVGRIDGVHRPQQGDRRELAALVDAHPQRFPLGDVQLDPAAPFGDDSAGVGLPLAGLGARDKIDTGGTVELTDHHPLGAIDNELATPQHDGDIAQVDFFFGRLLADQAEPDPERSAVGQPELATLGGRVAGLAQFVLDEFELERPVVAGDREDLAEDPFEPMIGTFPGIDLQLQKPRERFRLNLGQIGELEVIVETAKLAESVAADEVRRRGRHEELTSGVISIVVSARNNPRSSRLSATRDQRGGERGECPCVPNRSRHPRRSMVRPSPCTRRA